MHEMPDERASRVLDALADGLPLTTRPFGDLGARIGLAEDETIAALRELRERRVVVRLGATFEPSALGYQAALGALAVTEDAVETAADELGALPYVTHVFEIDDRYRLWFAIQAPSRTRLEGLEIEIAARLGVVDRYRVLPDELFKVTPAFDAAGVPEAPTGHPPDEPLSLGGDERALVRLLQGDLPLTARPFAALAGTLAECGYDIDEGRALDVARTLAEGGALAGFGGAVRGRPEPWRTALAVWLCPADAEAAGRAIASFPEALHVYERRVPGAGFALFGVLEAPGRTELDQTVARIGAVADLDPPRIAYPVREFKRAPMRLFSDGE